MIDASAPPADPFLLLDENRFAHAALERLRRKRKPGTLAYLYGPSGVGKSHLVRQFVRELRQADRALRIAHVTATEFAAELAEASDAGTIDLFQARYRNLDLLVCEDLHALEKRAESQRQLVAALDEILHAGGRVVLTCRRMPGELEGILARLVSRCHGGTCAAMSLPERPGRAALIAHFAARRQIPLSNEVIELLAESLPVSPRELLAAVVQLDACARLQRSPMTRDFVQRYLEGEVRSPAVTLTQVARAVARQFGVRMADLRRPDRPHGLVLPRQCAMFLARELTRKPMAAIADYFGRRHHTTVLHACRRMQELLSEDPAVRQQVGQIRQALGVP